MATRDDPIARFEELFELAGRNPPFDHTVMALATVDPDGQPSCRMVLLHGHDARGFCFYTNYESRKARAIDANPAAALCLYWPWLDQQVRIEGRLERLSAGESDAYFASRPRGRQLGAWASMQSRPLDSRDALAREVAEVEARYAGGPIPRPAYWGGYRLVPERIEFWKADDDRLHDRFLYTRSGEGWEMQRLYP